MLDLFCGAGGCSMGYHRAGFDLVGVDIRPQPRYPFAFIQADALEYLAAHGSKYDAIHASPPCQRYSRTKTIHRDRVMGYPDLVAPCRRLLGLANRPWVMENVPGSPLHDPLILCGTMFGLRVIRHRLFESNVYLLSPGQRCRHPPRGSISRAGRGPDPDGWICVAGHIFNVASARKAMRIEWMTRDELAQSIPPAYTEFIGRQLISYLEKW